MDVTNTILSDSFLIMCSKTDTVGDLNLGHNTGHSFCCLPFLTLWGNYLLPLGQQKQKGKSCYPMPAITVLFRLLDLMDCMWGLEKGRNLLTQPRGWRCYSLKYVILGKQK